MLKVKLCAIAKIYGEFCDKAYDIYCPLPNELVENFKDAGLSFSAFRLGQLVGKNFIGEQKDADYSDEEYEDYLIGGAVRELVSNMKYGIFEEFYTTKKFNPDSLFDSWKLLPNSTTNYGGYEYLASWGDIY